MVAIDVEPDSMFPQRSPHIVHFAVLACFSRGPKIANWDAAIYCAWVVRDSLVVGEVKRSLRNEPGSIDLGGPAFLVGPNDVRSFGSCLFWCQLERIRHSAEFGKRTGLHLPHQVGAMHLYRGFGDADIVGNLLVEAAGRNVDHDLALAGAERRETLLERSQCPVSFPTDTIAREAGLHSIKEFLITEWFCEELNGTPLHRLHRHWDVGMRCNEDDRHLSVSGGKIALKLETATSRHSHVEHQASRSVRQVGLGKIGNGRKLVDVQADRAEESHDRVAKLGIVIDDHDAGVRFSCGRTMHKERAFFLLEWPLFYSQSGATNSPS